MDLINRKYTGYQETPLGKLLITTDDDSLTGIRFVNQKYYLKEYGQIRIGENEPEIMIKTKKWLERYFAGEKPETQELSINPEGGEFRQEVWEILCQITYGKTITYGEIAEIIAKRRGIEKMSAQAVGGAVGHNPIAIVVPCHRVLGKNGKLTGYAGGLDRKERLLKLEMGIFENL